MRIVTYDVECFAYDWLVVFKDKETGIYTCIWNDNEALKAALSEDNVYIGFNSKFYDQYIIKAIAAGFTPPEIKQVNDYIIGGGQGWECPMLQDSYFPFNNVDIKDDMQMGLSLKAIEGHLGMSVKESTVPFDIDCPLSAEEKAETEFYCKHDVDTTEKLIDLRKDYLKNKINIGRLAGLDDVRAMGMTNAKLTAAMLKATPQPHDDERKYVYPDNLRREFIPQEVFDFFDRMYDPEVSDAEYFNSKLKISIGECPVTIGFGGIHGAIPNFMWEETDTRGIKNKDVGSYYPHLCTINGYTSRNIPSPQIYADVLESRMEAKAAGDTAKANALKLVCNTTYGCLLNKYNALFDPLMGRSVCISGQLYLLELARHCYQEIDGLRIVQLNTDGIMVELNKSDYGKLDEICQEWQDRTGFELETDTITKIAQKDVNNYVEVQPGGKAKAKGGYLVKGIAPAGAFNINNTCCIVATALKEYFVNDTPVEETINGCDDIFQFQIVAKAGAKYREAYHMVGDVKEPVQKVNRVYATADERYGKLYKVKLEDDSEAKIESLPEHCIIDNDNQLSINDVDKTFYIEIAKKRVNDFMGIKPEKRRNKMATITNNKNIYERLMIVRDEFAKIGIEKNGKNMQLTSKFFTLDDIVNKARPLFHENRILPLDNFTKENGILTLVDADNPDTTIIFSIPMREYLGNAAVTPVQAMGATVTYYRRYLYSLALDLAEKDELEEGFSLAPAEKKAPATPEQREKVKQVLTAPEENATDLQIKGLKNVLKKLKDADPSKEEMIAKIAVETEGFTKISKSDCEMLIGRISEVLEGAS
jgi:hypothetical protein